MNKILNKLLIFTKSPVLGEVKTRLQPDFSPEQSLILHKKLMLNTLELTKELNNIDVDLCCTPNRNTSFFLECENKYPVTLIDQQGADLGERMAFAISVSLQTYSKVIIIGTDCPDMDEHYIKMAIEALNENDVVIGPAADGGYVLLGLTRFSPELFSNILWGSDTVLKQTRDILNEIDWSWHELEEKHDVDRPEDLLRYNNLINELN